MRFARYRTGAGTGIAVATATGPFHGLLESSPGFSGTIDDLIRDDALISAGKALLSSSPTIDLSSVDLLPPLAHPGKVVCVGLNYADHSDESGFEVPSYPTLFQRFASGLIGHGAPIVRPRVSEQLDYEGEIVAVIGRGGRNISKESALDHVVGYSLFNDASIRDYQFKTPQWTIGKNFDDTGSFGPWLVTSDDLPAGCKGVLLETRLNGKTVQSASTNDLIFDVETLVSTLSECFAWQPGDIIVTGTPAGVGLARKPPLWMKPGDICEVEATGLGVLSNPIREGAGPETAPGRSSGAARAVAQTVSN